MATEVCPGAIPLRAVLKGTSRSFYLSLRFLPPATRTQVALAYLMARAADTLADTPGPDASTRLRDLDRLRDAVERDDGRPPEIGRAAVAAAGPARERELLDRLPVLFAGYAALDAGDRTLVRAVLRTLTGGMADDLRRFPGSASLRALDRRADLDAYTYAVAGCVGEFWTRIHARHLPGLAHLPLEEQVQRGVRLGQGLQLVNVLRDLPRDLAAGRCYLPCEDLGAAGLAPEDLRQPANWPRVRPLVRAWADRALGHFADGRDYVLALPPAERRLRLCSWWPLALGLRTLARLLRAPNLLDAAHVVKVGRRGVYWLLLTSWIRGASDRYVRVAFERELARARP